VVLGARLLTDIKRLFDRRRETMKDDKEADKYFSDAVCTDLREMDGRWEAVPAGKGRAPQPIDQRRLATILKNYRTPKDAPIMSVTIRIGNDRKKGYHRGDFEDAWTRYPAPVEDETEPDEPGQDPENRGESATTPAFANSIRDTVTTQRPVGESPFFAAVTEPLCHGCENSRNLNGEKDCHAVTDKNDESGNFAERITIAGKERTPGAAPSHARYREKF
jgi:hypothetical protein